MKKRYYINFHYNNILKGFQVDKEPTELQHSACISDSCIRELRKKFLKQVLLFSIINIFVILLKYQASKIMHCQNTQLLTMILRRDLDAFIGVSTLDSMNSFELYIALHITKIMNRG